MVNYCNDVQKEEKKMCKLEELKDNVCYKLIIELEKKTQTQRVLDTKE